jgi:uncharacterized protein (TIGR02266 family)
MAAQGKRRILVADDTLAMRIMLEDVLSEAGYEVVTSSDGEETWDRIQLSSKEYDLLILDLLMPKRSGFEILGDIKSTFAEKPFPILVITGVFKSEKEIQRLKELGAIGYISKSALVDEILFRVNSVFFHGQSNSRQFPRIILSMPVDYQYDEYWRTNYSSTLSAGGMFIRTVAPLPQDTHIFLKFKPPEFEDQLATRARVVWKSEYELERPKNTLPGMGLSFEEIPQEKQKKLDQYIRKIIKKEPIWF